MSNTHKHTPGVEEAVKEFMKLHYEPEHIVETGQDDEKCWCETETVPLIEGGNWLGRFEIKHREQRNVLADWLRTTLTSHHQKSIEAVVTENTSDGYHTFKELYEFRLLYNAALFNEWAAQGKYDVHKSQRHNDGELCFGRDDYFVVVATLPTGQISNHYPISDWNLFQCPAVEKAKAQWDGHTSQDVAQRLRTTLTQNSNREGIWDNT